MKRGRGLALLLALLFGVVTGGTLAPISVQAEPLAASILSDGQNPLALTPKSGKATIEAQRTTPDPILLPPLPVEIRQSKQRAVPGPEIAAPVDEQGSTATPYSARAPPAR